jgi:hypothetical protein
MALQDCTETTYVGSCVEIYKYIEKVQQCTALYFCKRQKHNINDLSLFTAVVTIGKTFNQFLIGNATRQ